MFFSILLRILSGKLFPVFAGFFLVFSLLTLSCQKEELQIDTPNDTTTLNRSSQQDNSRRHRPTGSEGDTTLITYDTIIPGPEITLGVKDSMQGSLVDRDLYAHDYQRDILGIDVNSDNETDIILEVSYSPASMGTSERKTSSMRAAHDKISFFGIFTFDSIFTYIDTSGFDINMLSTCHFSGASDDTLVSNEFHCKNLLYLDKLHSADSFASDSVSFIYSEAGHGYNIFGNYSVYWNKVSDCYSLPYGENIYLGFKYTDTIERLGWIQIKLISSREMFVNEWAIQRLLW
ncbi:MAG: hypothetical protein IPI30_14750 [Saprospiraceae bacterium]|nr:hypothetical protein [Candidatus Vicinibacter affinis]